MFLSPGHTFLPPLLHGCGGPSQVERLICDGVPGETVPTMLATPTTRLFDCGARKLPFPAAVDCPRLEGAVTGGACERCGIGGTFAAGGF